VSILDVLWGLGSALAVNECCDLSPWAARKVIRWSARLRYTDASQFETRAEELTALIDERPGKLFKALTALCFAAAALRIAAATTVRVASCKFWNTLSGGTAGVVVIRFSATAFVVTSVLYVSIAIVPVVVPHVI